MIRRVFGIVSVVVILFVVVMVAMTAPKSLCFRNCEFDCISAADSLSDTLPLEQRSDTVSIVE